MTAKELTRAKVGTLIDDVRMSAAQLAQASMEAQALVARIMAATGELNEGLLGEAPADFEIQPRIVRSA